MGGQGLRLGARGRVLPKDLRDTAIGIAVFLLIFPWVAVGEARADVTGTLALETVLYPTQSPSQEAEERVHIVDFRAHLAVGVQTGGLLAQIDAQLGTPGVEHLLLTGSGTLGAVNVRAQSAFAQPYASISLTSALTGLVNAFTFQVPVGPLLFVTHRVETSMTLFGVQIRNLAIFEDVNFRHPLATLTLGMGGPLPVLPTYTAQSQTFRFGDIVTVQGQFFNGSTLTMIAGVNADPSMGKAIQGHGFPGAVLDSERLTFVKEMISLQSWRVGVATVGLAAVFEDDRISASGSIRYPLRLGTLTVSLASPSGKRTLFPLVPTSLSLVLTQVPLTLAFSLDPLGVKIAGVTGSASFALSEIASLALQAVGVPGSGLQSLVASLLVNHPAGFVLTVKLNLFPDAPAVGTATVTANVTPFMSVQGNIVISPRQPQPQVLKAGFSATYRF